MVELSSAPAKEVQSLTVAQAGYRVWRKKKMHPAALPQLLEKHELQVFFIPADCCVRRDGVNQLEDTEIGQVMEGILI